MTNVAEKKDLKKFFKQKEEELQEAVMKYLALFYPRALAIHVPNEGKRNPAKVKSSGIKAGVPDVLVFERRSGIEFDYMGLAIELKVGNNKVTDEQAMFLANLHRRGWRTQLCRSFDEARNVIDGYLKQS